VRRVKWLLLQPDPIAGLDDADVSAVCCELLRVVRLAGQVAQQAGLADMLLPNKHELGPIEALLASRNRGIVCTDSCPALLRYLCGDPGVITITFFFEKRVTKFTITGMVIFL
jgi:hypothetical protein